MQIHLLSSQSSASSQASAAQAGFEHPQHLLEDLSAALRENGHRVEVTLLGDAWHGRELVSLREGAAVGRALATHLNQARSVLHALDPIAWAAALTARSEIDVSVVLRFSETLLFSKAAITQPAAVPAAGAGTDCGSGLGRVSRIGLATERRAYQACLRAADAIAAAADGDRLAAVRAGVPEERALVVPDVITLSAQQSDQALQRPGRTLLTLSGIAAGSGIETLLPALQRLPGRELVIAGSGSSAQSAAFRSELDRRGLADRVRWLGGVDRAHAVRLIDEAAVVVLPSARIGIAAAIEAMARSRAVATVDGGGVADVVVDGVTGSVVPAGRPELLAQALRGLLSNPFRLEAMGLAGYERALTRYARARAISATEHAYRVALGTA